jgi:hypothetical protein
MGGSTLMEKEYIVVLNPDIDFAQFNQEMIDNTGAGVIPNRVVDVANPRPGSQRSTHYSLTDQEAEQLKNDPRVRDVEIPPDQRDDIEIGFLASQSGNFTKTTSDSGSQLNWGMRRCMESTNPYGTSNIDPGGDFTYTLDGTGVDVVIQDSGLQVDHPEFEDADGVSRVQEIDWYDESGLTGTQSANHYRDFNGHGTHVAGTATGLTYGWAKNARIYSVKVGGLEGSGDSGGIPISNCFDVIKEWHNNKTNGRPTIVNMSWGYSTSIGNSFDNITSINYRGTTYDENNDTQWNESNAYMSETYGFFPYLVWGNFRVPVRVASVDSDVEEMIAAGVHVCIAAGNNSFKVDVSTGTDYDNTLTYSSTTRNYHRGSSPYSDGAFMVGSVDSATHTGGLDRISSFSTRGPGVTIWAPGSNIRSAFSDTNGHNDADYYLDSSFRQGSISGTSMASPQVCGLGATILQLNPHLTTAQLQQKMTNLAPNDVLHSTSSGIDYNDNRSLLDAPNKLLYTPFNSSFVLSAS